MRLGRLEKEGVLMLEKNVNLCHYLEKLACLGVELRENPQRRAGPRPRDIFPSFQNLVLRGE